MLQDITIDELVVGMYVVQVLEQTGQVLIKTEGLVNSAAMIAQLKQRGVRRLQVDPSKQRKTDQPEVAAPTPEPISKTPIQQELGRAHQLYQAAKAVQQKAFSDILQGKAIELEPFQRCADGVIESVFRNQDALLCMTQIREKDSYLLEHSLNVSILMTIFAKHLGLPEDEIQQLATGALLHDIGKIRIPDHILHKPGKLTADEFVVMKSHVNHSTDILRQMTGLSELSIAVAAMHHERLDGGGYPQGLTSAQLPRYARMIAIVDTYDAITATRCYKAGQTNLTAFKILRKDSHSHFDAELVTKFIQAIGVYPVGSLVKLKSQKLAIVTESNWDEPAKPKVKVFYHCRFARHIEVQTLDLASPRHDDAIEAAVKPEDFGIDLIKFFRQSVLG